MLRDAAAKAQVLRRSGQNRRRTNQIVDYVSTKPKAQQASR